MIPPSVEDFAQLSGLEGGIHLAIGVFDGVHLGHQAVIEPAVFSARRAGGHSAVLTFHPHPSHLFRPDDPTLLLMGIEEKTALLREVGVDYVIRKRFDQDFSSIEAESFLAHLKAALPALSSVYVGENFRFGRKRAGGVDTLVETGRALGIGVLSIGRIKHNGEPVSSTRVRETLRRGEMTEVNAMLGYNYFSRGAVAGGSALGRRLGFPTLNLPWAPECRPRFGVYLVRLRAARDAPWRRGVANYGVRPTVGEGEADRPVLEVHLLDAPPDPGTSSIEVEWLRFIRPERKFGSLDALREQIARDVETARTLEGHA